MKTIISRILCCSITLIYLQTLYFKFTAHPDSVYIFSKLGIEPWGRLGLGAIELFTAILVFSPKTRIIGVTISLFIITGAILSHLLVLGIVIRDDHAKLFILAVIVFIFSLTYLLMHPEEFKKFYSYFKK